MNHIRGLYRLVLLSLAFVPLVVSIPTLFSDYIVNATASNSGLNAIERLKRSIDSLHDKTITITTVHKNYNARNVNQSQIKNITG
jgi:hypothetical protein